MRSVPTTRSSNSIRTQLSESEWQDLRTLVRQDVGIKLSEAKRVFLVSRLLKRLRATGVKTFREYFQLVTRKGRSSTERQQLINAVTTNKTDFFREPEHFVVLADWLKSSHSQPARTRGVRIWCAASSTGEEPYTIAAVLRSNLSDYEWSRASVLASDIDTAVLTTARRGVYQTDAVMAVDSTWRMKMFVQGSGERRHQYRVRRDLREHVSFQQINLNHTTWEVGAFYDVVFCRNVLIYFDRLMQARVVAQLLDRVDPEGLLFLGHSESINGMALSAQAVAHAVYKHSSGTYRAPLGIRDRRSVGMLRAAVALTTQSAPTAPEVTDPQQRLRRDSILRDVTLPIEAVLENAALIYIYVEGTGSNFLTVVELPKLAATGVDCILRTAALGAEQLRRNQSVPHRLHAKIVLSSEHLMSLGPVKARVESRFLHEGIELVTYREQHEPLMALVIPNTTRIRLSATGPRHPSLRGSTAMALSNVGLRENSS